MPRSYRLRTIMAASIVALVLSGCGGGSGDAEKAAVAQPPLPLAPADAVTPVLEPAAANIEARVAKLEDSVGLLRSDYDRMMPAFASLNTTNQRILDLLDRMENGGKAASEKTAPTSSAQALAPAAAKEAGAVTIVTGLRIGEHPGKTRLVFDLNGSAKPEFTYDVDNAEKILLVDLGGTRWSGTEKAVLKSPMIAGWNAQKSESGTASIVVELKKSAKIISSQYLKAEGKDPARLVLDIAPGAP